MNSHQTNTDKIFSSVTCGADLRITVSTAQVTGSRHRKNRQPCQDTVLTRADGNFLFCGLADGQSGTEYGREGGLASLEAVADHIDRTGIEELLDSPSRTSCPAGSSGPSAESCCPWPKAKVRIFRSFPARCWYWQRI